MGNDSSVPVKIKALNNFKRRQPRVVLESPVGSTTDNTRVTKVTFADTKRDGVVTFKARPQMEDVGIIHADVYNGGRVRYQRRSTQGSTNDVAASTSSVQSSGSIPVDGNWQPTLDPHSTEDGYIRSRYRIDDMTVNEVRDFRNYTGFSSRQTQRQQQDTGLARVDEI